MTTLLERLRKALAADYDVTDELASGGMGVVYRARDRQLDRTVAIKVIRPEQATAAAAERFVREARLLAAFSHPNIVQIHRAGQADGIGYYVMDYLDGETLADRLQRGPLGTDEAGRCAGDLLAALDAVHTRGIVHRDVKPSNIFLAQGRAVLSDFGISKSSGGETATTLTQTGAMIGTPGYMPPEQYAGADVSAAADVCAAAMVVFEAFTGRPWSFDSKSADTDWTGVPDALRPVLRRALAWDPAERFPDAGQFRGALARAGAPTGARARWIVATAMLVIAGIVAAAWPRPVHEGPVTMRVHPFTSDAGVPPGVGDSVSAQLVRALQGAADLDVRSAAAFTGAADVDVNGQVTMSHDTLHVTLRGGGPRAEPFTWQTAGSGNAIADSAARALLLAFWNTRDSTFRDLPVGALPATAAGLSQWTQAEAYYARAQWGAAARAYELAIGADSSCALCRFRLLMIMRWLRVAPDSSLASAVRRARGRFSPPYQAIIRATLDSVDRWSALQRLVDDHPRSDLGHFVYGDELFHRGPLAGHTRGEALVQFGLAVSQRPHFAPALEHLAWVAIAEGDSVTASAALGRFEQATREADPENMVVRALLTVGYAWRFQPTERAVGTTEYVLSNPLIAQFPDLRWGPRYLLVFDTPEGVLWMGNRFTAPGGRPELRTPGLVAAVVGTMALGRMDSARAALERLRGESSDREYALSAAEFDAVPGLMDTTGLAARQARLVQSLAPIALAPDVTPLQRRRAAWLLTLLSRRGGADEHQWRAMVSGEAAPAPFATLLDADARARSDPRGALALSAPLLALDSAGRAGDPFFRSVLHWLRASWQLQAGDTDGALRSLLWSGNYDIVGQPGAPVQPEDADWAFGTMARWRRTQLVAAGSGGAALCRDLADVARLWREADAPWKARADSAAARRSALRCPP